MVRLLHHTSNLYCTPLFVSHIYFLLLLLFVFIIYLLFRSQFDSKYFKLAESLIGSCFTRNVTIAPIHVIQEIWFQIGAHYYCLSFDPYYVHYIGKGCHDY